MKKLYSKQNLVKVVSLGITMTALLSSVSPIFAANLAMVGGNNQSTNGITVVYPYGSHGSIVFNGDDDHCGVDNVFDRGGKQQQGVVDSQKITVEEQYMRFINGYRAPNGGDPYGTSTDKVTWLGDGNLSDNKSYMGPYGTRGFLNAMPEAYGVYSFATGCGSSATGNYSTAFGAGATTRAGGSQAFGVSALASGKVSVAMGVGTEASGESTVAIGGLATASGKSSFALGTKTKAIKSYAIAIGTDVEAQGSGSIAIGSRISDRTEANNPNRKVIAEGENAIAIGTHTFAEKVDTVAIGANAQALVDDGVAVGGGSVSDRAKKTYGYDPYLNAPSTDDGIAWKSTAGAFSIGEVEGKYHGTLTRQITGVAAGSKDTDAVNVAQLRAMRDVIAGGGTWKLSANDINPVDVKTGDIVDFSVQYSETGKDNLTIAKSDTDNNKHKIQVSLSDNLKLTSVTTGQSRMSDDGFIIDNGPKVTIDGFMFGDENAPSMTIEGIDAGNKKITKVADATEDHEAVNYKQLKAIAEATKTHWQLTVDGESPMSIGQNDTVNFIAANNQGVKNIKIVGDDNRNITFDLAEDIKVKSVHAGNTIMNEEGFRFVDGGPKITVKGVDAGNKKITKVAAGTGDTDAVNYKQLRDFTAGLETGWKLAVEDENATDVEAGSTVRFVGVEAEEGNKESQNIKITKGANNEVKFALNDIIRVDRLIAGKANVSDNGFVITGGPTMTTGGINAGNKQIKGVANGSDDNDAVNVLQLNEIKDQIIGNNLVQWDEKKELITIGVQKGGTKIDIAGTDGERTIAGVKNGAVHVASTEAINGSQLWDTNQKVANIDTRVTAISGTVTDISEKVYNLSQDALLWSEEEKAFVASHEKDGSQANSKITHLLKGDIHEESTDAINGSQINKISGDIAQFFGGGAAFEDGAFKGPKYSLSTIVEDGQVAKVDYNNVGDALTGLDANFKNVNSRLTNVTNNFNQKIEDISQDALLWSEEEKAFVARHGKDGSQANSKITHLLKGDIHEESTDAINGSQINKISGDIAQFFGGSAAFEDGAFAGPRYNLSKVFADGKVEQKEHTDVGSALTELDTNVRNVNSRLSHVTNEFNQKFDDFSQDALLWSEKEKAFVALHGPRGEKKESKITYLLEGDINEDSTDAVNGSQIHYMGSEIANYFGGGANYKDGKWTKPTFKVSQRNANGNIVEKKYHNVADAFEGVDDSITDIYSQINNVTENSLVKQDGENGLITVGKATGGTKISIANKGNQERTLSGVKDGELSRTSTEAVNGSQLFAINESVITVTDNLSKVAKNTSEYFGGNTDVLNGIKPSFFIDGAEYNNVTEAFTGVNVSIHRINNQISDVIKNSLVKQNGISAPITIGKDTAGTEINVAGVGDVARKISGVREAEKGDEAVNKNQLDKSIEKISNDIEIASAAAVLYDKNENGTVNYDSVTLGGEKGTKPVALLNVKDGRISKDSHDAINGSQINKISGDIANYFGGGASFENGAFKGPQYSLSVILEDGTVGKVNHRDVGSALTGLDANVKSVNSRLTNVTNNFNQKIEGISKDALLWDNEEQAFVARHEKNGQKTNSKLKYLLDGDISKGSTDAITGNQLYLMSNQLAAYFGGGAKYENGRWTNPNFKIVQVNVDGTTVEKSHNNVADAFGDVNKNMSSINNRIDNVIKKVDSDALKWNSNKKAYDANRNGQPSKIINVADGKIEEGSKDAVNGGQLWKTNQRITDVEKDVKHISNRVTNISNTIADIGDTVFNIDAKVDNIDNKVNNIAEDAVRYDRDENGKKINKITLKGSDASEPVLIDNVANGRIGNGSKEAVNGGQLHDYTKEQMKIVLDQSKHYTDQRVKNIVIDAIDDAVERANNYTNIKFDALNYSIENVRKEARQAAAIGLAVANLRYNDTPGKLSVGFGTGLWRSQSAFAFGAGYTSEKGNIRSNVSVTTSGGHWGVGAGFNMTLN